MSRRYYSSRNRPQALDIHDLHWKLQHLYMFFREGDYFKEKAGIWASIIPDKIKHEAAIALSFQPFPITKWNDSEITDDHIFDALEFLYDHVSKPGDRGQVMNHDGYTYSDYWSTTKLLERQSFVRKQTGSFAIMDQDMN